MLIERYNLDSDATMGGDVFAPTAPARVRCLVLPVGKVKRSRFTKFVRRLQRENVVRLGDVSPDGRPHRTMFSPLAFPDGLVHFDISPSLPPSAYLELVPFEPYRLPLLVVGIIDWSERMQRRGSDGREGDASGAVEELSDNLQHIREDHPSALAHRILAFDCEQAISGLPQDVALVPPRATSRATTIKTVMCDMAAALLAGMSTYGKSLQEKPTIETPKADWSAMSNGTLASHPPHMAPNARPTSMAVTSGSSVPAANMGLSHRLSMPAHVSSNSDITTFSPGALSEFSSHGTRTPPHQSEESLPMTSTSPPGKPSFERYTRSQDRNPITGFGPGSTGERERNRGKARVGVVIGSLYLLAGRWPDAIRELSKGATTARTNSDYVWLAKAMDYLVVCLLMCAWAGIDFKIPDVLRPAPELLHGPTTKKSKHSPSNSQHNISLSRVVDAEKLAATIEAFASLLPDIIYYILNLYGRAYTFTDEKIPPLSYDTSILRFGRLLTTLNVSQGKLNADILGHLAASTSLESRPDTSMEEAPFPKRPEVVQIVLRAYPGHLADSVLPNSERLSVLAGIVGILLDLGQYRKVAVVLREMLSTTLPPLVQARKDDAAEMGIHPAASLAALNHPLRDPLANTSASSAGDAEEGMRAFLSLACRILGISRQASLSEENISERKSDSAATKTAMQQAIYNEYGAQALKIDLLWACINICEALPDLAGSLLYSAILLRTASSGIAPEPESSNGVSSLSVEEQQRLANVINRTLVAAQHLGMDDLETEFWDEFLVRSVELVGGGRSSGLTWHATSELNMAQHIEEKKQNDPFIHNPFPVSKSSGTGTVLVAQEEAVFQVMLQNLFDFDLAIDSISLIATGMEVDCPPQAVLVGPYRTQTMLLSATPRSDGKLTITACKVKVRGCRERISSIFRDPWALRSDVKGRRLQCQDPAPGPSPNDPSPKVKLNPLSAGPKTVAVELEVIRSQPALTLEGVSLAQSAVMLLEGERKAFKITLRNISSSTPADLVLLSFMDSTAAHVQEALASKEISAAELYELELSIIRYPALRLLSPEQSGELSVQPLANLSLQFEVFGKTGLADGIIQLDYGFLGVTKSDIKEQFYTRQIAVPVSITVHPCLELRRSDMFRVKEGLDVHANLTAPGNVQTKPTLPARDFLTSFGVQDPAASCCILLLDFQNAWHSLLTFHFSSHDELDSQSQPSRIHHRRIRPGSTARIPIPIPRTYLPSSKSHAPIPSLNPATKRQFIVSSAPTSPAVEREAREAFWYREAILSRISATWTEEGTGRTGVVDLRRNLHLAPRMVAAYKLDDIVISMSIHPAQPHGSATALAEKAHIKQLSSDKFEIPTSTFVILKTKLFNRSPGPIRPLLRLQPALANQAANVALDLHRKLLVHGLTQRMLPELGAGDEQIVETGFIVLSKGTYEWSASVEEVIKVGRNGGDVDTEANGAGDDGARKGRPRARTGEMDLTLEDEGRKTWFIERNCVIIARDE